MSHMHLELDLPPKLPSGGLRVIPLGGLGEIGRNMTVFEFGGKLLIVDCGVLFPEEHHPGVDLILPDFGPIRDRLADIVGIVLTHGHEDHIGGVPYLLRERDDIPVIGSRLTLALVDPKLKEHRLKEVPRHVVSEGETLDLGPFTCEFVAVNHSIPDALAVAIKTPAGVVLHTGDFKMDQLPLDGRITDLRAFARLGEAGVDLFLTDSTNAEVPGFTTPERNITPAIDAVFAPQREAHHRGVVRVARAPRPAGARRRRAARSQGGLRRTLDGAQHADRPRARLPARPGRHRRRQDRRRAAGEDGADVDRVAGRADGRSVAHREQQPPRPCSSSPATPCCSRRRSSPATRTPSTASSTGSPSSAPTWCTRATRSCTSPVTRRPASCSTATTSSSPPTCCRCTARSATCTPTAALAKQTDVPNVLLAEDGFVIDLVDGHAAITGAYECGYVYVDGSSVGDLTESELKDRRTLGDEGFISVVVVIDSTTGKIVSGPEIHARGLAEEDSVFDEVQPRLVSAIEEALSEGAHDTRQLQQVMRRTLGSFVGRSLKRRPMIIPIVLEA